MPSRVFCGNWLTIDLSRVIAISRDDEGADTTLGCVYVDTKLDGSERYFEYALPDDEFDALLNAWTLYLADKP